MTGIAVIFDMDGVIIDNISYHIDALNIFCKKYNCTYTDEEFKTYLSGKTVKEVMKFVFRKNLSKEDLIKYSDEKEELYRDLYKPHLKPTTGLLNLLSRLKDENIKTAVATAGPSANVNFVLEGLKIAKYFNAVINGDMVTNGKPHPEIYLKAAKAIDMQPQQCIVIEDSLSGILSGKNAGMKVIGITTVHKKEELYQADYIINNFNELNLEVLNKIITCK
ncbi:MAG: HAD family phosphatase [Bacteroidales bacterium]|nr:HAD family phosphatase [Bacteroidales bacterium]